jgi:hypothetical protein
MHLSNKYKNEKNNNSVFADRTWFNCPNHQGTFAQAQKREILLSGFSGFETKELTKPPQIV